MMEHGGLLFNPPPGWPKPPKGWTPPKGWQPDPNWPAAPPGWELWIPAGTAIGAPRSADSPDGCVALADSQVNSVQRQAINSDRQIALLEAENAALRARLESVGTDPSDVVLLDDERVLQDVGIYRYHHLLENAVAYREKLDSVLARIAEMTKAGTAIEMSSTFTFDGSLAKGCSMTSDLAKLMLRAYNAEAENVGRTLRAGNAVTAIKRLDAARTAIAKLGKIMEMRIGDGFHALRVEEIELIADYLMKKDQEREAARAERERLREERKVALELAAAREKLEKERSHILTVIEKIRASGTTDPELERKLADLDKAIELNDYRAANIRAGYVYVISNRGAFGDGVLKIGLTRRLEPLDRVYELGDASVPFRFDVHAIFFSENAVSLEQELHQHFSARRVNWANERREFFFATPAEVRTVLSEKLGNLLEFAEHVESTEYLQSIRYWPRHIRPPQPAVVSE
jgi:hypothetical protein